MSEATELRFQSGARSFEDLLGLNADGALTFDLFRERFVNPDDPFSSSVGTSLVSADFDFDFEIGLELNLRDSSLGSIDIDYPVFADLILPEAVITNTDFTVATGEDFFVSGAEIESESLNFSGFDLNLDVTLNSASVSGLSFFNTFFGSAINVPVDFEFDPFDIQDVTLFSVSDFDIDGQLFPGVTFDVATPDGQAASAAQEGIGADGELLELELDIAETLARISVDPFKFIPGLNFLSAEANVEFSAFGVDVGAAFRYVLVQPLISAGFAVVQEFRFVPNVVETTVTIEGVTQDGAIGDAFAFSAPDDDAPEIADGFLDGEFTFDLGGEIITSVSLAPIGEIELNAIAAEVALRIGDEEGANIDLIDANFGPLFKAKASAVVEEFGIQLFDDVRVDAPEGFFGTIVEPFRIAAGPPRAPELIGQPDVIQVSGGEASALNFAPQEVFDFDTEGAIELALTVSTGELEATSGGGVQVTGGGDDLTLVGLEAALTAFLNSGEVKYSAPPNVGEAELTIVADDRDGFANTGFPPIRLIITDDETDFLAGGNNGDVLNAFDEENGEGERSVSFSGGGGDDRLIGSNRADFLSGGSGDDRIDGNDGNDRIFGGADNDFIDGGEGSDTAEGGGGADTIRNVDVGFGGDGDDNVDALILGNGGDGNDGVTGETAFGGAGDDRVTASGGRGEAFGGDGDDQVTGETLADGGPGDDELEIADGFDGDIFGGDGNDTATASDDDNLLDGGDGDDLLRAREGDDSLFGGDGDDNLSGNEGDDLLFGGSGVDTAFGGEGDDLVEGGEGDDVVGGGGGGGQDVVDGGAGNDEISGFGSDLLGFGGIGNDSLFSGDGEDTLFGGVGDDVFDAGPGDDLIDDLFGVSSVEGGEGDDHVTTGGENDTLIGDAGDDTLIAGAGNDFLTGERDGRLARFADRDAANLLDAGGGDDIIVAGDSGDTVRAGEGDDAIVINGSVAEIDGGPGFDVVLIGEDFFDDVPQGLGELGIDRFQRSTALLIDLENNEIRVEQGELDEGISFGDLKNVELIAINHDLLFPFDFVQPDGRVIRTSDARDTVLGGSGDDNVLLVDAGFHSLFGGDGSDTLEAAGSSFFDGGAGADLLIGGFARDTFVADFDDLFYDGGDNGQRFGQDTVTFENLPAIGALTADITDPVEMFAMLGTDLLEFTDIQNLRGRDGGDDTLFGGLAADSTLEGLGGNDALGLIDHTRVVVDGGEGVDTLVLLGDQRVTVILRDADTGFDGSSFFTDVFNPPFTRLRSIENIIGTDVAGAGDALNGDSGGNRFFGENGDDTLNGNDGADDLNGGLGDDALFGGEGDDTLDGGDGNDTLTGGDGGDLFRFVGAFGQDEISRFDGPEDQIEIAADIADVEIGLVGGVTTISIRDTENAVRVLFANEDEVRAALNVIAPLDADEDGDNTPPVAVDDRAEVDEDQSVLIDVAANDQDDDGDDITVFAVSQAENGEAVIEGGQIRYSPDADFNGRDAFSYSISDGEGGQDIAEVIVDVAPVNDAPDAKDDRFRGRADQLISGSLLGDNGAGIDEDIDGDALFIFSVNGEAAAVGAAQRRIATDGRGRWRFHLRSGWRFRHAWRRRDGRHQILLHAQRRRGDRQRGRHHKY